MIGAQIDPPWRCLVALLAIGASAGCELFGLGTIRCRNDEFCPTGYRCCERVCVPTTDLLGNPIDAGVTFDAAWTGPRVEIRCDSPPCCAVEPCSLMPDSATQFCGWNGEVLDPCPSDPGDEYFGQDGNYDTGPPDYEWPGNDTVVDHVTGLVWERNPSNDLSGGTLDWQQADLYCRELTLAGYSWRLPTFRELVTLVDYGVHKDQPMMDDIAFPLTSSKFWTATGNGDHHWWIEFGAGTSNNDRDSTEMAARCVSGGSQIGGEFDFIEEEGDWLDVRSGLAWSCDVATGLSWVDALSFCENSTHSGHSDWRLPSIKELETIVDRAQASPFYSLCPQTAANSFFSSSPCVHESGPWSISIYGYTWCNFYTALAAMCVRSAH
ncbi:MAG: DUF1566 domain-containing protein [Deltaproteobacteria bacterium]|nr:DUF1566 domain-containing protein [Deltaproteobacteria bacterium]